MARATRTPQQTTIRLERRLHVLARFHDELRALAPSARTQRLIDRNERERIAIGEKLGALRGAKPAPPAAPVK